MKVDVNRSAYHEAPGAVNEFNRTEIRRLRYLLRRLRFLETKVRETGGIAGSPSGGAVHAELEAEALEFVLDELGFLAPRRKGR